MTLDVYRLVFVSGRGEQAFIIYIITRWGCISIVILNKLCSELLKATPIEYIYAHKELVQKESISSDLVSGSLELVNASGRSPGGVRNLEGIGEHLSIC